MILIALVAWLTTLLVTGLEKLLCPWKREVAGYRPGLPNRVSTGRASG